MGRLQAASRPRAGRAAPPPPRPRRPLRLLVLAALVLTCAGPSPAAAAPQTWEQAQKWYEHGQRLEHDGFPGNAIVLYREIIAGYPDHFNARVALGRLLIASDPAEAVRHLEAARDVRPTASGVYDLLGQALEAQGKLLDAAEAYRKTVALDASNLAANDRLRGILRTLRSRQSTVQQAAEHFWDNPSLATLTLFGRVVMRDAEPRQALLEFESLRPRVPQLPEVELWIARAYHELGDASGEIRAYTQYLAQNPDAVGVRLTLVERLIVQARYRTAQDILYKVMPARGELRQPLERDEQARRDFLQSRIRSGLGEQAPATQYLLAAARQGFASTQIRAAFEQDVARRPADSALRVQFGHWLRGADDPITAVAQFRAACAADAAVRQDCTAALTALTGNRAAAPYAQLALGEMAQAQGRTQEAIDQFSRIPLGHPADRAASLQLGMIYRSQGDIEKAIDAFTRYVLSFPDLPGIRFARGNLLWVRGARDEALGVWLGQPQSLVGRADILREVAPYIEQQGRAADELAVRTLLRDAAPDDLGNRVRLGSLLLDAGRDADASQEWHAVLAGGFGDYDVLVRIGRAMLAHGRHEQALQALWQAAQLRPLDDELSAGLAQALAAAGRNEEALHIYWQLYRSNPRHPAPRKAIPELVRKVPSSPSERLEAAQVAAEGGSPQLALNLLEELLPLAPELAPARLLLARLLLRTGSAAEAERVLLDWPGSPDNAERWRLLVAAQEAQGHSDAQLETLQRLQRLDPADTSYDRMHGLLLAQRNRLDEAAPLLQRVLAAHPQDMEAHLVLARYDTAAGRAAEAERHYQAVLAVRADDPDATAGLQSLYNQTRQWDPLIVLLEGWLARHPQDLEARDAIVGTYLRAYRAPEARPQYELLQAQAPDRARRYAPYFR